MLAGEARSSVLAFWHSFVEPFFGRGQRQYTPLHTKMEMQQLEAEEHVEKQSSSSEEPEEPKGEPPGHAAAGVGAGAAVLCLWGCVGMTNDQKAAQCCGILLLSDHWP